MSYPIPTPIFHITSIKNLKMILDAGALTAKSFLDQEGCGYCNIAHEGIQNRRSTVVIDEDSGRVLNEYVPFYFAPRSPMLYAIKCGNVTGCMETQENILYFATTVEAIDSARLPYVFTNGHAIMQPLEVFDSISDVNQVDWETLLEPPLLGGYAKYWQDRQTPSKPKWSDRCRRRQAEFLVHQKVSWQYIKKIVVINEQMARKVRAILAGSGQAASVEVEQEWYY